MSLHSIFTFHVVTKPGVTPAAKKADTEPANQVISATWKATADTLRASLSREERLSSSVEMT